jgi:hypothetical protein
MGARSILGVSAMRPAFLVDLSTAQSRKGQGCNGAGHMTMMKAYLAAIFMDQLRIDDDPDDDDESEFDEDEDDRDDDDADDDEEDDTETWQVSSHTPCR